MIAAAALPFDDDRLPWLEPYRELPQGTADRAYPAMVILAAAAICAACYFGLSNRQDSFSAATVTAPVTAVPAVALRLSAVGPIDVPAEANGAPVSPSPGGSGQAIQIGAFQTTSTANRAFARLVARHPVLASRSRIIVPITTRPSGRTLYALRVGTASRQQSGAICRTLRARGDQCLVIG